MQGRKRKVIQAIAYEAIALAVVVPVMAWSAASDMSHSAVLGVALSVTALVWNVLFNTLFERWESRQTHPARTMSRRLLHAVGFEGGFAIITLPMIAWWLDVGLWQAILLDAGLVTFFMVYTFVFQWCFDCLFGVPAATLARQSSSCEEPDVAAKRSAVKSTADE